MPLSLIVGPPNSGRAGEVRRRFVEAAGAEPLLVVPTGDDVARFERELCEGLSGESQAWQGGSQRGVLGTRASDDAARRRL